MSSVQRINTEVQARVPVSSSETIVSIRYRIAEGTTIIYNVMMQRPTHVSVCMITWIRVIMDSAYVRVPDSANDCTKGEDELVYDQAIQGYRLIRAYISKETQARGFRSRIGLLLAKSYRQQSMTLTQVEAVMV